MRELIFALCLASRLYSFFGFPLSDTNNQAVSDNINQLNNTGGISADLLNIANTLDGQSQSAINAALAQMAPASYSSFTELQVEIDAQIISLFHKMPYLHCGCAGQNRFWLEPFGSGLILKHHGQQIGSRSKTAGLALGYDWEFNEQLVLGVGGAWNISSLRWRNNRGHGHVNGFYGGFYADYKVDHFYLGASFLAGADLYGTSRHMQFTGVDRHAKANFQAAELMAQLATAYFFGTSTAYLYPYANFDFFYHHVGSYREKGASGLDLHVSDRTDSTFRTEMGLALQIQDTNYNETICISPLIALGWVNLCPVQRPPFSAYFIGGSPLPFKTSGWDQTWNLLSVDFGLGFTYYCGSLNLRYRAELSPDEHTLLFNQYGNIRLDIKW